MTDKRYEYFAEQYYKDCDSTEHDFRNHLNGMGFLGWKIKRISDDWERIFCKNLGFTINILWEKEIVE
ncbi:hypothetical protein [Caulobacter phage Cr30]|uniref:hypothetical protein n=1 Tax=Caulobacter phage Cr30 TaxID=1357714 RepID=UPI0004A9BAFD|nr:hypothetical protein OZ74_gp106 [Caulobacter phage Cr30]AGS80991.1 hypothetical protein [Caulobacter phage Cr30]